MAAGAPAIVGQLGTYENKFSGGTGALYISGSTGNNNYHTNGGGRSSAYIHFNASRSSSIYGASNTIRPTSKQTTFLIRY